MSVAGRVLLEKPTPEQLRTVDASQLPHFAGNNWNDPSFRDDHRKRQVLSAEFTGKVASYVPTLVRPREDRPKVSADSAEELYRSLALSQAGKSEELTQRPTVDLDDKTLGFSAYCSEVIPESATEPERYHLVKLTFFPSDETLSIVEPRIHNSGLLGGMLLKRQRVPLSRHTRDPAAKNDHSDPPRPDHICIDDLNIGKSLVIYGVEYCIYDCDPATRTFLTSLNITVPPSEAAPDVYVPSHHNARAAPTFESRDLSIAMESLRSQGKLTTHFPDDVTRARRFVTDSNKVLRYFAYWDDRENEGTLHYLDVRYFVEDDTISIVERPKPAKAGEPATGNGFGAKAFLSRRRLPRGGTTSKGVELTFAGRINGMREVYMGTKDSYYEARDLSIGCEVNVFGRKLVVYSCDAYTREYMSSEFHVELAPDKDVSDLTPAKKVCPVMVPPPTGYGTPEDSMVSCKSLVLSPPKKSLAQAFKMDGKLLRFKMKLHEPERKEDGLREFCLTYYCDDDEMMITENAVRNTGFTGGKFMKKQKMRKIPDREDASAYYHLVDIRVGNILNVDGFAFLIVEADANTTNFLKYFETGGRPPEDLAKVEAERLQYLLSALGNYVVVRFPTNTEAFRAFDSNRDGHITLAELYAALKGSQITSKMEEAAAILQHIDEDGKGFIAYPDFFKAMSAPMKVRDPTKAVEVLEKTGACRAISEVDDQLVARKAILKKLRDKLEARCMNVFEMFRMLSTMPRAYKGTRMADIASLTNGAKDTVVTPVQLRRGIVENVGLLVTKAEMAVLLRFFFPQLPESMYDATADKNFEHAITLPEFQAKFIEVSSIDQIH